MSLNLGKIVAYAALPAMMLFSANKTFAQAERSVLKMKASTTTSTQLPSQMKVLAENKLNPEFFGSSTSSDVEVTMMGDTIIVQDEQKAEFLKKQPIMLQQINQVVDLTKGLPKGSVVSFEVSNMPDKKLEVAIYTEQENDRTAYFHGTPAENLKKSGYSIWKLANEIKTNNRFNKNGQHNYSWEVMGNVIEEERNGDVSYDDNFKPTFK